LAPDEVKNDPKSKGMITIPGTKTTVPIWAVLGVGAAAIAALLLSRKSSTSDSVVESSTDESSSSGTESSGLSEALASALENLDQRIQDIEGGGGLSSSETSAPDSSGIPLESPDQSTAWESPVMEVTPLFTEQVGPNLSVRPDLVAALTNVTTGGKTNMPAATANRAQPKSESARSTESAPVSAAAAKFATSQSRALTSPSAPSLSSVGKVAASVAVANVSKKSVSNTSLKKADRK
jgi:hypothetical protein